MPDEPRLQEQDSFIFGEAGPELPEPALPDGLLSPAGLWVSLMARWLGTAEPETQEPPEPLLPPAEDIWGG